MISEHAPDLSVFDPDQGRGYAADDEEIYLDVLQTHMEESYEAGKKLQAYLEAADLVNYEIVVHGLKNALRVAGAPAASERALDLELHCKSGELDYVRAHHQEFLDAMALAERHMRRYLRGKV